MGSSRFPFHLAISQKARSLLKIGVSFTPSRERATEVCRVRSEVAQASTLEMEAKDASAALQPRWKKGRGPPTYNRSMSTEHRLSAQAGSLQPRAFAKKWWAMMRWTRLCFARWPPMPICFSARFPGALRFLSLTLAAASEAYLPSSSFTSIPVAPMSIPGYGS
jgi:hypothetical protein